MNSIELFTLALGLEKPWIITKTDIDPSIPQLDIHIDFERGSKFLMPDGAYYTAYDSSDHTWQHLNFFQYRCYLHARIPWVKQSDGKTEVQSVPWNKPLKRGRGSQKKTKVLVMAESKTAENPKSGKKPKEVRYLKMKVISDLKSNTITKNVKEHIENTADLITDDSTSYTQLKEHVHSHTASVIPHQELPNVLLWVHTAISNAKRQLLDVYYKMKPEYLQYDLNQFCYKFNRRYFGEKQFDRLLIAAVTYTPYFKSRIYNRNRCG